MIVVSIFIQPTLKEEIHVDLNVQQVIHRSTTLLAYDNEVCIGLTSFLFLTTLLRALGQTNLNKGYYVSLDGA